MVNLSKDIQCADFDTRSPMLDRTDFASWQQRIRLYCRGKENGVNILKSIDEGPFQMGTFRETLAEGTEGALHLGPERPRVYSDLTPDNKERYNADIRATNILLQGFPKDIYTLINHFTDAKDIWDNHKGETIHDDYVRFTKLINDMRNIKMTMSKMQLNSKVVNNMLLEWGRFVTAVKLNRGLRDSNYDQQYAYLKQHKAHANENKMMLDRFTQHTVDPLALMSNVAPQQVDRIEVKGTMHMVQVQLDMGELRTELRMKIQVKQDRLSATTTTENEVALDEEQLLFLAGGQDNVVDEGVDEQLVHDLALNVDNLFQADDCDSFDSDVDEAPTDSVCEYHEVHEMHDDVQPNYVVYSHADYTSDSNIIPYDQYVKDNAVPVLQSNVSSVPNDAYMMNLNDIYESPAKCVSVTTQNNVIDNSLTAELSTYNEQVELYERRAKFELIEREQKIDEQLRIVITDRNIKEEILKKELHSVKMQLTFTVNHNKSMVEEVTSLKKDFKQKENKYLEEFLDMKALKEKVEDKL
ncbi:hypothetical protein Tco_0760126 [Tanacetum coccineum]